MLAPQRGGEPADLVPVAGNEPGVDADARQPVQRPVVGLAVDAPQPLVGQVGQPRCPPVAQRPGQGKDDLGGVGLTELYSARTRSSSRPLRIPNYCAPAAAGTRASGCWRPGW